jgi:hypothetical protein
MVKSDVYSVMFATETGGRYCRNVAYVLKEQRLLGFINQFTLKHKHESKAVDHRKNDYWDMEVGSLGYSARVGQIHLTGNTNW